MDLSSSERNAMAGARKHRTWWRSRRFWAVLAVLVLGAALYAVLRQDSNRANEPVVEGPPPYVSASGPVVPEKRAKLSFTTTGRVKSITVQPGDLVRQGQLLARLEPSSLQMGTVAASDGASDLYIIAPFDGTAGLVLVSEGESVAPGTPVVILGDLSTFRVEIEDLSESDVGRLEVGQPADITFEAFPGPSVAGRVARISPMNNAKGGGVNYDVVVEFIGGGLPPVRWGMTAHAEIRVDGSR